MPDSWSRKDEKQYRHVRKSMKARGADAGRASEVAARVVNSQRRKEGRTPNRLSQGTGNPNKPLTARTRRELYNRARQLGISGRSRMNKGELVEAIREH